MSLPAEKISPATPPVKGALFTRRRQIVLAAILSLSSGMLVITCLKDYDALKQGDMFEIFEAVGELFTIVLAVIVRRLMKRADEQTARIVESERRFRTLADCSPNFIWMCDAAGLCTYANKTWLDLTGLSLEGAQGNGWARVLHPEDVHRCVATFDEALAARRPFAIEYRVRRGDGEYRWVYDAAALRLGPDGAFEGFIGAAMDVTDRVLAERRAETMAKRFETLTRLAPVGIGLTDAAGRSTYRNDCWYGITGLTREQGLGEGWQRALHPDDRDQVTRDWKDAAARRADFSAEFRYIRPDGSTVWIISRAVPMADACGDALGYVGVITDVTPLKNLEVQLRESLVRQTDLTDRERLLRHELDHRVRNNLAALLGLLRLYERGGEDGRLSRAVRAMVAAMIDAHELIATAPGRPIPIGDIARRIVVHDDAGGEAMASRLTVSGPDALVPSGQVGHLAMVLQELVSNSRKHGALASASGRVEFTWTAPAEAPTRIDLRWRETGIAAGTTLPGEAPARRGVGMTLIETLARNELRGSCRFEFERGGMTCTLTINADAVSHRFPAPIPTPVLTAA